MTFALLNLCLVGFAHPARAEGPRHAAMVIDANTGKVLHAANADVPRYPASLTKLMTLYLVFETLETGALQLDSPILVSEAAASVAPSKLELAPGETIELADAIKALVTKSANDMAVAIAEKISGSERAFAELMTKRARQIGMNSTTFRNASGLPDMQQQTTARDMLTLALRIYDDFPDRARVFSLREFTFRGKTYRTHNTLMKSFAGMNGMKTGYTSASGFNLVASVRRDGKNLVAAVFGGATASSRNAHMRQILNQALEDAATEKTRVSRPQLIASVRPAARPQNDGARPQNDGARPQNDGARPQKTQPTATWPQAKVATAAPAPTPAARPPVKAVETAKPAAIAKPVA
ncbi:MAG: D-alanyl-D-alanine carboxypeptidase family protein, partial [Hyphomicrobium sp.]